MAHALAALIGVYLREVQQASNTQIAVADVNLLIDVHVPLQLHGIILLAVYRTAYLLADASLGGPAILFTAGSVSGSYFLI